MIPQVIEPLWDGDLDAVCSFAHRWTLEVELARKLICAARDLPFRIQIISGFRTREQQEALIREEGSLAAPVNLSTHCACPAQGADIHIVGVDPRANGGYAMALAMVHAIRCGLRVGGGGPVDEQNRPVDWNHWDLGPRTGPPTP
jgi:hypothetical protein